MARCPFAQWTPLPENWSQPRITPTQIILHSAVSRARSLYEYFSSPGVVLESHFYIGEHGETELEEMLDTEVRADANYWANPRAVSIETWDNGDPDRVPWNPAQITAMVRLLRWLSDTHSIPLRPCPAWDAPGVGYHSQYAQWSPVVKTCPGLARRPQVPTVIAAARSATPPEDDMAFTATDSRQQTWLIAGVFRRPISWDQANALTQLAQPVAYQGAIDDTVLGAYQLFAGADASAIAAEVLANLTPAAIAAAIPGGLAGQVVDELHRRTAD